MEEQNILMDTPPESDVDLVEREIDRMSSVKGFVKNRSALEINWELSVGKELSLLGMGEPSLDRNGL